MPQSHAAVYIHVIFSTKHREPTINPELLPRLCSYFSGTCDGMKSPLLIAGGVADHVHLLMRWSRELTFADGVRTLKASSSRWIHDTIPNMASFAWQAGYGTFSVSRSQVDAVRRYIETQEEHHRRQSFQDEFREFLRKHDCDFDERYVWD